MLFAWSRWAVRAAGGLVCIGLAGMAAAAENLPLLQVDPALLGVAPSKPAKPAAPAAPPQVAPPKAAEPRGVAAASPVAAPPVARELPPAAAAAPAAPAPAVSPRQAVAPKAEPAAPAAVATQTQPPQVAERPALPPLYTAHVAAGALPHPATTPFSATDKASAPTHVTADKIDGLNDVEMVAAGNAVLTRAGDTLAADRIVYRQLEDEVEAIGNVRLSSPESVMSGPRLRMRMEESTGEFESPAYLLQRKPKAAAAAAGLMPGSAPGKDYVLGPGGRILVPPPRPPVTGSGTAERLEFRGEDQYHLENATYSTCSPGQRDWEVSVDELDLDYQREVGKGRSAVVSFKDVPIFYMPWMSFSLNNQKKSGFLPPTVGSTSKSGFEFTAPWFWNIAPNMDATLTPRVMTRRGLQLNAEFRYLLNTAYNQATPQAAPDRGQVRVEYLPGDNLANRDRYGYSILHSQMLANGLTANLNLNGVSDPNYFSDLSTRIGQVSQGNLLRQGVLSYGGPWYGAALNVQSYQTLITDPGVTTPYRRMPQLTGFANRHDLPFGSAFNLNAEYVSFDHPTQLLGKRTTLYPQLSWPLTTAAFWVTPKIGYHSTHYELSGQERSTVDPTWKTVPATQSRGLPIASIDGGFVMERNTDWFGQSLLQTLEPRAYYLYVPQRDQQNIPVFDTGLAGFGYAQMFSENRYAGGDRIADANQLTVALTSRLIDPVSGAEYLRATLGQLYYFTTQNVTLPGETARTSRKTDILAALSGQVLPHTHADFGWQYNPRDKRTERLSLGGRYQPAYGKVFNAGYRYSRDLLDQIDVSAQWPVFGGWNAVGRYNYSLKESRVIETIAGVEYDAGCWAGRVVVQRLATIANQPTSALFFQLELKDFSRIGSNPLDLLRRSIPGYGVINQPTADPIFGAN